MNKKTKGWLLAAALMMIAGLFLFWGVVIATDGGWERPIRNEETTKTYGIAETFHHISVETDTDDVLLTYVPYYDSSTDFLYSEPIEVICPELENRSYSVRVENDTLVIRLDDQRKWYDYISLFSESGSIIIRLPEKEYGMLTVRGDTSDIEIGKDFSFASADISVSTGDVYCYASVAEDLRIHGSTGTVRVEDVAVGKLDIGVSTGNVTVSNVSCAGDLSLNLTTGEAKVKDVLCKNLTSTGSTGDLVLENVSISEKLTADRSTGDIKLDGVSAEEMELTTDTGDVSGHLLEEMIFFATTDTGDISVPQSTAGGKCVITTDTGDISITVP